MRFDSLKLYFFFFICVIFEGRASWIIQSGEKNVIAYDNLVENHSDHELGKINVMWSEPAVMSGKSHWQFHITEFTGGSIGLISKLEPEDDIVGLFYDGGLNDGKNILKSDYGPELSEGDIFEIMVDIDKPNYRVHMYHNHEYLGMSFNITDDNLEALLPAISFEGKGSVIISSVETLPSTNFSSLPTNIELANSLSQPERKITGPWLLDSLTCQDNESDNSHKPNEIPTKLRIALVDKRGEYQAVLSIINTSVFPLVHLRDSDKWVTPKVRVATNLKAFPFEEYERWMVAFTDNPTAIKSVLIDQKAFLLWSNEGCFGNFTRLFASPVNYSPFKSI